MWLVCTNYVRIAYWKFGCWEWLTCEQGLLTALILNTFNSLPQNSPGERSGRSRGRGGRMGHSNGSRGGPGRSSYNGYGNDSYDPYYDYPPPPPRRPPPGDDYYGRRYSEDYYRYDGSYFVCISFITAFSVHPVEHKSHSWSQTYTHIPSLLSLVIN